MNARERFHQTFGFGTPDRVPYWETIGFWPETIERWHTEGLPEDVYHEAYFGLDRREQMAVDRRPMPLFPAGALRSEGDTEIYQDEFGIIFRRKPGHTRIPQYLRFPIRTRADWEQYKKRLNPDSPARYPLHWDDYKRCLRGRDYPIFIHGGSLFGWLRNWMGIEAISYALYDDPAWVEEMMDHLAHFGTRLIARALTEVGDVDYVFMWEDMCYRSGPLISPDHFRRLMVPRYKVMAEFIHSQGVKWILMDCDGNHDALLPMWLEAGINGIHPLEVAAGEDPVALRKEYGRDLVMVGGIDKRALIEGGQALEREVYSKVPFLIEQGGWIPSIDHAVPPDVPLPHYLHYWSLLHHLTQ